MWEGFAEWKLNILTPPGAKLLPKFKDLSALQNFHLVGGTALSLYLGHRESIDFDFFTPESFPAAIVNDFASISEQELKMINSFNNSLEFILDDVKIFLWTYKYPLLYPLNDLAAVIKVSHPIDIAIMKIFALEGRVTWKDLVDLYFIDRDVLSLEELADIFYKEYPNRDFNEYSRLRAILDEHELELSPKPKMLVDVDFEEVKTSVYSKLLKVFSENMSKKA